MPYHRSVQIPANSTYTPRAGTLAPICVALSGEAMLDRATALLPECTFFEFRLDTVERPAAWLPTLEAFLDRSPQITALVTCRRRASGGCFDGSARDEARVLHGAAIAGAAIVDLSIESAEYLQQTAPEALNILRHSPAAMLLSWHNYTETPPLDPIYDRLAAFTPDLIKIVPTAVTLQDSLRVLRLLQKHRDGKNLIAMAMGITGVPTRVLGPSSGSAFTFAAPDQENGTAPGQVDLRTLRDLYRIGSITPATRIYGVFGDPISGSKSPAMLNAAFAAEAVDAVYLPFQTADAATVFHVAETLQMQGASVTMPLKEQILPMLNNALDSLAAKIGAANTLTRDANGRLVGSNTDAEGIADPLARRIDLAGANILVLGAGGAARAAVFALRAKGANVSILNRSAERADELARQAGARVLTRAEAAANRFDAIVHATPHGMQSQQAEATLTAEEMNATVFFDLVYNPLETPLLQAARAQGLVVIPGLEMFLAQGAAQFTLWTGKAAPEAIMGEAVLHALQ